MHFPSLTFSPHHPFPLYYIFPSPQYSNLFPLYYLFPSPISPLLPFSPHVPSSSTQVRDLDEGEEELEAALDRWLAEEDREYIEVEEPQEPVEMVDSWCQVSDGWWW